MIPIRIKNSDVSCRKAEIKALLDAETLPVDRDRNEAGARIEISRLETLLGTDSPEIVKLRTECGVFIPQLLKLFVLASGQKKRNRHRKDKEPARLNHAARM